MRILIILTYYRPHYSGLTIYAERLARSLVERGHQVTVLTSQFDRQLLKMEDQEGVTVIRSPVWFHISKGVIMPGMPFQAWRLINQHDIVNLHAPQFDAALIAVLSSLLRKPVVLTYHCDLVLPKGLVHSLANRVSNLANHISASLAQVIVHNTRDYAEHSFFLRKYLAKLNPIYPPVNLALFSEQERRDFRKKFDIQPEERIIGVAARLATEKGIEYLALAFPKVLERHPNARILFVGPYQNLVGEESYYARLQPIVSALGKHWTFLGVISSTELAIFFHECEVTVLPSINSTESYGMVQVESLSCNTPVIATDMPGVRVPVSITRSGKIVLPADAESLATAIIEVLDNPEAYQGNPELIVRPSAPSAVAEAYEGIFLQLISPE